MRNIAVLFVIIAVFGCRKSETGSKPLDAFAQSNEVQLSYATGFKITYDGKNKLIEVMHPYQGATSGYRYLLVPKGEATPEHGSDVKVVSVPLTSIVCTSTSHLPLLDYLDETDRLIGFPSTDYVSSERIRKRIDEGLVVDLGIDKGINLEQLAVLKPDLVMAYSMNSDYGQFKKMEELGLPVVINAEYLEKHPLGRAEWIKFMAAFFDKEQMADSVFKKIEQSYLETQQLVASKGNGPTVLSGIVYGNVWFLPGGQNYAAKILKDAGCNYLWGEDTSNGFLEFSFESVYEKAHDADLWIGVGSASSLRDIEAMDHRYTRFKPYQEKKIYTYDARKGAKGGSEFLELGYLRPDLILNDLVKIAYPDLLPEHELYFHKKLE